MAATLYFYQCLIANQNFRVTYYPEQPPGRLTPVREESELTPHLVYLPSIGSEKKAGRREAGRHSLMIKCSGKVRNRLRKTGAFW